MDYLWYIYGVLMGPMGQYAQKMANRWQRPYTSRTGGVDMGTCPMAPLLMDFC